MTGKIKKTAVIGAGLIGAEWAAFFASKGLFINLCDIDKAACDNGVQKAVGYLDFMNSCDIITAEQYDKAQSCITPAYSIEKAVENVDFVQEAASERYEVKKRIFEDIDRCTLQEVIVTSSSSALLMSEIQKVMQKPRRALIAHPFNPAHLVPLVELVPGDQTDKDVVLETRKFYESLGKVVIVVAKEVPGYVANRLQAAIWREAIDMVLRGIVSVEDVDKALYAGPGIRYSFMGQHLIYHLGGGDGGIEHFIDHIGQRKKELWKDMASWTQLPAEAKQTLAEGIQEEVGGRTICELEKWRDEKLASLLKIIYG